MGSLLIHVFTSITHTFPLLWVFSILFFFFSFFCFALFSFFLSVFSISLVYRFSLPFFFSYFPLCTFTTFYTACHYRICHFYPLTTFGLLWVSFQDCSLVCWLPSHHHYTVLAVPHLIPKQKWFCFVSYSP